MEDMQAVEDALNLSIPAPNTNTCKHMYRWATEFRCPAQATLPPVRRSPLAGGGRPTRAPDASGSNQGPLAAGISPPTTRFICRPAGMRSPNSSPFRVARSRREIDDGKRL